MATMNVSLPDAMKDWVESQTRTGRYGNASDYVRDLIRRDQNAPTRSPPCSAGSTRAWRAASHRKRCPRSWLKRAGKPARAVAFKLSRGARQDIIDIYLHSEEAFGEAQADRYIADVLLPGGAPDGRASARRADPARSDPSLPRTPDRLSARRR